MAWKDYDRIIINDIDDNDLLMEQDKIGARCIYLLPGTHTINVQLKNKEETKESLRVSILHNTNYVIRYDKELNRFVFEAE